MALPLQVFASPFRVVFVCQRCFGKAPLPDYSSSCRTISKTRLIPLLLVVKSLACDPPLIS